MNAITVRRRRQRRAAIRAAIILAYVVLGIVGWTMQRERHVPAWPDASGLVPLDGAPTDVVPVELPGP
jgi:hypothetical protein